MTRAHLAFGLAAVLVGGCSDDGGAYTYMDDDIPSGRCGVEGEPDCPDTSGGTTGPPSDGGPGSPCDRTGECDEGLSCAAPFSNGERGSYACVEACIQNMDEARWCADAGACCDPEAVCTMRGYCVGPGTTEDGSTGDEGSTGGDTSTGEDTSDGDDSTGGDASTGGDESTDDGGATTVGTAGGDDR